MRIVNICMGAPFTEGYTYQDNLLPEYQHKIGHDVTIITSILQRGQNGKVEKGNIENRILNNGVRLIRIKTGNKIRRIAGVYPDICNILDDLRPDLIYVHGLASHIPAYAIQYKKKHTNVHLIADNHQDEGTTYTDKFPFNFLIKYFKLRWRLWIKYFDKIYGVTSWRVRFAHELYGIPESKLDTLIMGIDEDKIPSDKLAVRKQIRQELQITDGTFVFITGGKLDHHKKTLETLRAFSELKQDNVRLLVFGTPLMDIKEEFNRLVKADKRIINLGYVDSKFIHRYFLASDFGLFPGRHSVLWEEAIGCGLPCLFKQYEEHDHTDVNGNCIRMENFTENDIYVIMMHLLSDYPYYQKMKKAAVDAAPLFSYRAIAEKSLECVIDNVGFCKE